jgi:hypothetical protein
MKKEKCPHYIKSFATGLKCVVYHGGNSLMTADYNSGARTAFGWTGAKPFVETYCKKDFQNCRFYQERRDGRI